MSATVRILILVSVLFGLFAWMVCFGQPVPSVPEAAAVAPPPVAAPFKLVPISEKRGADMCRTHDQMRRNRLLNTLREVTHG